MTNEAREIHLSDNLHRFFVHKREKKETFFSVEDRIAMLYTREKMAFNKSEV